MAADNVVAPDARGDPAGAPAYDPTLDPAIRALLDQQTEIQAKLATLLPQKYGPNIRVELDMLRHKLRILHAFASDNRKLYPVFKLFIRRDYPLSCPARACPRASRPPLPLFPTLLSPFYIPSSMSLFLTIFSSANIQRSLLSDALCQTCPMKYPVSLI